MASCLPIDTIVFFTYSRQASLLFRAVRLIRIKEIWLFEPYWGSLTAEIEMSKPAPGPCPCAGSLLFVAARALTASAFGSSQSSQGSSTSSRCFS